MTRKMYFRVVQQVVRQDLGHWLGYLAARSDGNPSPGTTAGKVEVDLTVLAAAKDALKAGLRNR